MVQLCVLVRLREIVAAECVLLRVRENGAVECVLVSVREMAAVECVLIESKRMSHCCLVLRCMFLWCPSLQMSRLSHSAPALSDLF